MGPTSALRKNLKIVYVEDNAANILLMQHLIKNLTSYELITVTNANEGIEQVISSQPDLVLMDIALPGINGIEALKILKSNAKTASIPVVAISADATQQKIDEAMSAGFEHYLIKPIDLNEFATLIDRLL